MPELNTTGSNKRPEDLSNIERSSSYSGEKTSFTEQSISDNRPALRFGALKPALNYSSQELANS
ncbi:MAG: hypothetical protein D6719_03650 [Candidatus Dadabacteria bacterium]|nr:MAG: hypothetical protein D6719_03650 [Candidatus Dadabacteria bacterium]